MAKKRNNTGNRPEIKRLEELEREFQIILARYRGEDYDLAELDAAIVRVDDAIGEAARAILRRFPNAEALAANARLLLWRDMLKKKGGFSRYDGVRPIAPFVFKTLKWCCLGRENQRDQYGRRTTVRDSDDDRRDPDKQAQPKPGIDRHQVPLEFDLVDRHFVHVDRHEQRTFDDLHEAIKSLPERERKALLFQYWEDEGYAELACDLGISESAVTSLLHRTRNMLREKLEELGYRRNFTGKGFRFGPP